MAVPGGFAPPTALSRISRDVFLYDKHSGDFLVKPWASKDHRSSKAKFGNAFGTFLCRPPKSKEDLDSQIKHATVKALRGSKKKVLVYDMSGGTKPKHPKTGLEGMLGFKTEALETSVGGQTLDLQLACVSLPSMQESSTSLILEPMTVLAYFAAVRKDKTKLTDGAFWVSKRDATDPAKNLHASVVSTFLHTPPQTQHSLLRGKNVLAIQEKVKDLFG